jgi:PhnB protein
MFVDSADSCVRFLETAFDGQEIGRSTAPDGRIANCQMKFGTATIMVSEASKQFPTSSSAFYLYVSDAEASMARAIAAGAEHIMDVANVPYGDRTRRRA